MGWLGFGLRCLAGGTAGATGRGSGAGGKLAGVGPHENGNAGHHKRDAEPLAHVQSHGVFKLNLWFLDELDEEPHAEATDQEPAEVETAVGFVKLLPVEPQQYQSQNQIGKSLIQLRGMLWLGFAAKVEHETPGQGSDVAVDLGVEKVAQTDKASGEGNGDAQAVHNP